MAHFESKSIVNQNQMDVLFIYTFSWLMMFDNSSVLSYRCITDRTEYEQNDMPSILTTIQLWNEMAILTGSDNHIMVERDLESTLFFFFW